jgi:uncharacterized protein YjbI with pentapeptide repeats
MPCAHSGCPRTERRSGWCLFHLPRKDRSETSDFTAYVEKQIEDKASGEPNFESFVFPAGFQFRRSQQFANTVNFRKVVFEGDVVFDEASFLWGAIFDEAEFLGSLVVKGSVFGQAGFRDRSVSFTNTEFQNARFEKATFHDYANFRGAKFSGNLECDHIEFQQNATFQATNFSGQVSFTNVVFHLNADFSPFNARPTVFSGYATFAQSVFHRGVSFENVEFRDKANFDNAQFGGFASFNYAKFLRSASFFGTTFSWQIHFNETEFRFAKFEQTTFRDVVSFKAPFAPKAPSTMLIFHFAFFEKPRQVSIFGVPFSSLSFLRTDVAETLIVPPVRGMGEAGILDEELLHFSKAGEVSRKEREEDLKAAVEILRPYLVDETIIYEYKNLRKSLESNRLFNEAAELFIREMRLTRNRTPSLSFEFAASWLYDKISLFGESIKRPILWSFAIALAAASSAYVAENWGDLWVPWKISLDVFIADFRQFLSFLTDVVTVFFQMRDFSHTQNLTKAPVAAEILLRISSIVLLGNLFVAVKRRLERK